MRRSKTVRTAFWSMAPLYLMACASASFAQTKYPDQTSGTAAPAPSQSPPRQQSPQQPSTAPAPTTKRTPSNGGIKIDPEQAARTIIDIFGKKKKRPVPQEQPAAAPTTQTPLPEPPVAAEPAAPVADKPPAKSVVVPRLPSKSVPNSPMDRPARSVTTEPSQPKPVPLANQVPVESAEVPVPASADMVETAPAPVAVTKVETSGPIREPAPLWPIIAALLALAALIAATAKWFLFPKARFDLEFETGDSRLTKTASPFASSPDAKFSLEFEWGPASAPHIQLAQAGV
jgi:hypothetical protein